MVTGGGSGHEPAHGGFIGPGMLSAAVRAGLSLLPEEIPQCVNYFYGGDLGLTKVHTDEDFDFAIIADFDNYKDYQIYATHPAHQEFTKRILRPLIKNRAAVQFLL